MCFGDRSPSGMTIAIFAHGHGTRPLRLNKMQLLSCRAMPVMVTSAARAQQSEMRTPNQKSPQLQLLLYQPLLPGM